MLGDKKRAKVTGVTLNITNPDGTSRVVSIDPRMVEGVFWSDQAVVDVLGTFYDHKPTPTHMSQKDFIERYGAEGGEQLYKKLKKQQGLTADDGVKLDKEAMKTIWDNEFPNPGLEPYLTKTRDCKIW